MVCDVADDREKVGFITSTFITSNFITSNVITSNLDLQTRNILTLLILSYSCADFEKVRITISDK